MATQLNPYEQTVRTCTVFFSAAAGLGLKELFGRHHVDALRFDQACCFAAALFLLLRFLFGSANHLWAESIRCGPSPAIPLFIRHILYLLVFFCIIMRTCYSTAVTEFLIWQAVFSGVAVLFAVIEPKQAASALDIGATWIKINVTYGVITALFAWWESHATAVIVLAGTARLSLVLLVLTGLILLLWDLDAQIKATVSFAAAQLKKDDANATQSRPEPPLS